jgi:hypothetical protein
MGVGVEVLVQRVISILGYPIVVTSTCFSSGHLIAECSRLSCFWVDDDILSGFAVVGTTELGVVVDLGARSLISTHPAAILEYMPQNMTMEDVGTSAFSPVIVD